MSDGYGHQLPILGFTFFFRRPALAWLDEEWVLAFRLTAGVKQSAYDTFMDDQRDDDRPLARAFLPPGCLTVSGACDRHYRSGLLNDWPSAHIDDVSMKSASPLSSSFPLYVPFLFDKGLLLVFFFNLISINKTKLHDTSMS